MNMRRTNWKTVSTLATMALLSGCMEQSISAPGSSVAPTTMMMVPASTPQLGLLGSSGNNTSSDFTISPAGGRYIVGNHVVEIPANAVCDPDKSSYGPGTWDSSCKTIKSSLKIHAEVRTSTSGRVWLDFSPNIRFAPSADADNWAYIWFWAPAAIGASDLSKFNVLYASSIGGATTDESVQDPSLRTYVDTRFGIVKRRIKHFSGYTSSSGKACDPNLDPDCYWSEGDAIGGEH
ncbi:MAG: hypothetical protein JWM95_4467 [Gemmatimonadetes bacterium]|nr:hypothetical protein [Gemmatimonadota bacterium]